MIRISLVIPFYNSESTLPPLLESMRHQTIAPHEYEIIMVDDGSTDRSAQLVTANPQIILLTQTNSGPGAARNLGTSRAQGRVIAYTDSDCVLPPTFLQDHIELHEREPTIAGLCGSVAPAQRLPYGSPVLADHLCSWFNAHGHQKQRAPEYLWGANMSVKRCVHEAGVRWSESRVTGEDVDFSHQLSKLGLRLYFEPKLMVRHYDRTTLRGYLRHQYNWGFHAPFIRGRTKSLAYSRLFPASVRLARIFSPAILVGYTALVARAWWRHRPLGLLSSLPLIVLGKVAYASGAIAGTKALAHGSFPVLADRRAG